MARAMENGKMEKNKRVILFLDVDSFSIQIYQKDHPEFDGVPCVLLNENKLASISYEAKAYGITRENTLDEAKMLCSHIEAFELDLESEDIDPLESSRRATWNIKNVVEGFVVNTLRLSTNEIEIASPDELYVDITEAAISRARHSYSPFPDIDNRSGPHVFWENAHSSSRLTSAAFNEEEYDTKVYFHGSVIAQELCDRVRVDERTKLRCSAGVGENKLIAKVICGLHRPSCVTVVSPGKLGRLSSLIKIENMPGLGGRGGELLKQRYGVIFVRHLSRIPDEELQEILGVSLAEKIKKRIKWIDDTPVTPAKLSSELVCRKKYEDGEDGTPQSDEEILKIVRLVAKRMALRLTEERERNNRRALNMRFGMKPGAVVDLDFLPSCKDLTNIQWEEIFESAMKQLSNVYKNSGEFIKEISLTVKKFTPVDN